MAMTSDAEDDVDVEIWQRSARRYQLKIGLQIVFDNKRMGGGQEEGEWESGSGSCSHNILLRFI